MTTRLAPPTSIKAEPSTSPTLQKRPLVGCAALRPLSIVPSLTGLSTISRPLLQRQESEKEDKKSKPNPEDAVFKDRVKASAGYRSIVETAFNEYGDKSSGLTVDDLLTLIATESSGDPNAVSGSHRGLFQLSKKDSYDSREFAAARKANFNKTKQDREFTWSNKGILDPTMNIRYGVFVVMERGRQAQKSIGRKATLEDEKLKIEADQIALRRDKENIPKQLKSETDLEKEKTLREQRGALRGRGKDLEILVKKNTKQLEAEKALEPQNTKLKKFIAQHPGASAYLLHQQGITGLRNLLGDEKGAITKNQRENLTDKDGKSVKTKKDFVDYWVQRYDKMKAIAQAPDVTGGAPVEVKPKLSVNTPGDKYEQEADRVAEQVMRMPEPKVQRQCACGKSSTEGECSECKKRKHDSIGSLQRVASSPVGGIAAPPIVSDVLSSSGSPLPTATRSFMESRFGHDFSHVRVHTDQKAVASAAAVQARAYTVSNHVVFGRGESPSRDSRLLAHELTHVIQQTSGNASRIVSRAPDPTDLAKIDGSIISTLRKVADDWMSGAKNLDPKVFSLGLDLFQFALDIIGVVEPTPVADGINTAISVARGDWWGAGFSALGMIPYVGDLAKAGKFGKYARSVTEAIELAAKSPQIAKLLRPVMEILADSLKAAEKHLPSKIASTVSSMRNQLDMFLTKGTTVAQEAAVKASDDAVETAGKALDSVPSSSTGALDEGAQSFANDGADLMSPAPSSSMQRGNQFDEMSATVIQKSTNNKAVIEAGLSPKGKPRRGKGQSTRADAVTRKADGTGLVIENKSRNFTRKTIPQIDNQVMNDVLKHLEKYGGNQFLQRGSRELITVNELWLNYDKRLVPKQLRKEIQAVGAVLSSKLKIRVHIGFVDFVD
jgi:hypothetical protein